MMKQMINKYKKLLMWCAIIFAFSSIPSARIHQENLLDLILRKMAHISEFFILTLIAYNTFKSYKKAYFFSFIYAISDELHQRFVPGRGPSIVDVGVDTVGIILGIIFIWKGYLLKIPTNLQKLLR